MVNPYTVKDLKCMELGRSHVHSLKEPIWVQYEKATQQTTGWVFIHVSSSDKRRQWEWKQMQVKKQLLPLLCPSGVVEKIFFLSLVWWFAPTFPWADPGRKGWHPSHTLPSQKLPFIQGTWKEAIAQLVHSCLGHLHLKIIPLLFMHVVLSWPRLLG